MTEAQGLALAHADDPHIGWQNGAQHLEKRVLATVGQFGLQLVVHIEVIFDRPLGRVVDQHDFLDAGGNGLVYHVLDHRLVDHGDHFLGDGFAGRQETGTETGDRKYGFSYCHYADLLISK